MHRGMKIEEMQQTFIWWQHISISQLWNLWNLVLLPIQSRMLKLGDSIKICVSCALSYCSNVWHDLPSGSRGGHSGRTPFTHFSWRGKCHIFYERTNYIFFMNSKILHFFPTIHFVTAWGSGTFPLTYTLKDMSVQQVFPFGTEIYSDKSLPIGCYS